MNQNGVKIISLKTGSWSSERTLELTFPAHWKINHISGVNLPAAILPDEIQNSFNNPVQCRQLEQILQGKKTVAIIIDDHTRPTPVYDIVTELISRIKQQGILPANIKLIIALGTHVLKDTSHLKPKLKDLLDGQIKVVLPDLRRLKDYVLAGTTPSGIPVHILREYAEADVKIAVSGIYPHDEAGFSGGAKIMIGLLGLHTLSRFHRKYSETGRGKNIETPFRHELELYADIAGIDWGVTIVMNHDKKIHKLWCGDFRAAFRCAAEYAKIHLGVEKDNNVDVIISNAYPLDTSLSVVGKSLWPFHNVPKSSRRILIASPVIYSDFRVPFCTSKKESILQMVKRLTGVSDLKKVIHQILLWNKLKKDIDKKWTRGFVYFFPDVQKKGTKTGLIIRSHYSFLSWNALMNELQTSFPKDKCVTVSIYDNAPLHYPLS